MLFYSDPGSHDFGGWGPRSQKAWGLTPKLLSGGQVLYGIWEGHHPNHPLPTPALQVPNIIEALGYVTKMPEGLGVGGDRDGNRGLRRVCYK